MIFLILIILVAIIFFIAYLFIRINDIEKSKSLEKELARKEIELSKVKNENIILPKIPKFPDNSEVDKDYQLLSDVLESVKIESWTREKFDCRSFIGDSMYEIEFINPQRTLKLRSCIYPNFLGKVLITELSIYSFLPNSEPSCINYYSGGPNNGLNNDTATSIFLNFIWEYIIEYENDRNFKEMSRLDTIKDSIQRELKTINRDRQINKLV